MHPEQTTCGVMVWMNQGESPSWAYCGCNTALPEGGGPVGEGVLRLLWMPVVGPVLHHEILWSRALAHGPQATTVRKSTLRVFPGAPHRHCGPLGVIVRSSCDPWTTPSWAPMSTDLGQGSWDLHRPCCTPAMRGRCEPWRGSYEHPTKGDCDDPCCDYECDLDHLLLLLLGVSL